MTSLSDLQGEERFTIDAPGCPECDALPTELLEACVKVVPLVMDDQGRFIPDLAMGDVQPCGDATDTVRLGCANGHFWTAEMTPAGVVA